MWLRPSAPSTVRSPPSSLAEPSPLATPLDDRGHDVLRNALLSWGEANRRDLPWRHSRNPWEIHVAEVMLQQTQVDRVLPRWNDFLERFPTVSSCADASPAAVIELWDGLGYNRRAMYLHRAAVAIDAEHEGAYPDTIKALRALPGIGAYTARAILAFAMEHDVAVVDTNVGRILARLVGRTLTAPEAQALADSLVPPGEGWAWNQTILDLGALICTKKQWQCGDCPWERSCQWIGKGPDPAVGSAGVSTRQSRFEGSDRQGRGRLIASLRHAAVAPEDMAAVMGWPDDPGRAERVLGTLVRDGMVEQIDGLLRLPV